METLVQKVARLRDELTALQAHEGNEAAINQKAIEIHEAEQALAQEQAAQVRIQDATEQAAYFLDNLVIEGLTMRELCVDEPQYQMLRIAVQNKIINLAEDNSRNISEIQAEEAEQQRKLRTELAQSQAETADYQSKLKNATDEITRLEGHIDDLRKEIAVGARNAYKVTDVDQSEQLKQLAEEIKASRIKITGRDYTDYTRKTYKATLMQDLPSEGKVFGDQIEFPTMYAGKYTEVTAAEAEQFRAERASNQTTLPDSPLGNEETPNVTPPTTPEVTFPELPSAIPPNIPGEVPVVVPTPESSGQGRTVEERVEALERRVTELEKVCSLNEEAA